ncbi:MAG: response regulator transcription factor [Anaerocolumna sp.]
MILSTILFAAVTHQLTDVSMGVIMKILIIEDELNLAEILEEILKQNNYLVDICRNGKDGWDNILTGIYDGIVLDLMLPTLNGFEILKAMRKNNITTPVLILTARAEIDDIVSGLDYGADDYMTKPFNTEEFLARLRAVTRRKDTLVPDNPNIGDIILNKSSCELICGDNNIKLRSKEFQIMEFMINNQNQIISRELLVQKIWGFDNDSEYNNVEVYLSFLRKKLKTIEAHVTINNTKGLGYHLEVNHD